MSTYRKQPRRGEKLPEFAKNLNVSQRACLTKFTKTGERDTANKVTTQQPVRKAAWEARKQKEAA